MMVESDLSYQAIVDFSPSIIWFADKQGRLTFLNKTGLEYTGCSISELRGDGWLSCLHPEDKLSVTEKWQCAVRSFEKYENEFRIRRNDGSYRWFQVNAKPIWTTSGEFDRWVGHCSDNHDRKIATIAHQNAVLIRDRFMSLASHELRTPLTSMKLQMQILNRQIKRRDLSILDFDHLSEVVSLSLKQVEQLDCLIDEMLDVSRISSGQMTFEFDVCTVEDLIKKAVSIVSTQYRNAHVHLDLSIEPNLKVTCDENKICQVIINLLTNALKYGDGNPVKLIAKQCANMAQIEVVDQGIGIPCEAQKKIFEPFERVDTKSAISGLGLGLYISQEVIRAHKGKIAVTSKPRQGSKFLIEIPLLQKQMNFFESSP